MRRSIIAVLGLSAGIGLAMATPAAADPPVRTVTYLTTELSTPEGVAAVHERLQDAARDVCREANRGTQHFDAAVRSCQGRAIEVALEEAGVVQLADYHEISHGRAARPVTVANSDR